MPAPLIEMRAIERTYVMGDNLVHALRTIDLKIDKGASIAIMGTSGSGKSTLMNILGCLDQPTKGTYMLDGSNVARLSRAQLAEVRRDRSDDPTQQRPPHIGELEDDSTSVAGDRTGDTGDESGVLQVQAEPVCGVAGAVDQAWNCSDPQGTSYIEL